MLLLIVVDGVRRSSPVFNENAEYTRMLARSGPKGGRLPQRVEEDSCVRLRACGCVRPITRADQYPA